MRDLMPLCCALTLALSSPDLAAVETAPRISDREIIETLTRLEAGQNALKETMNQRFKAMEETVNLRFETVNQRFSAMERRFDDLFAMILAMFSALILLIVSLFGYIVWDRRTALRPLESRLARLEQDLERDLELRHEQGSLPTRLVHALRSLASDDERLARVLRSFSLL